MGNKKELADLINRNSLENGSDTPDFILAEYLKNQRHGMKPLIILMCIAGTVLCFCLGARTFDQNWRVGGLYLAMAGGCWLIAVKAQKRWRF